MSEREAMLAERYPHEYGQKPEPPPRPWGKNFLEAIEAKLDGEPVEAWVCGDRDSDFAGPDDERYQKCKHGVILDWEGEKDALDYRYDASVGGTGCNAVYIWTATRVLFATEYDRASGITAIPRNPISGLPGYAS